MNFRRVVFDADSSKSGFISRFSPVKHVQPLIVSATWKSFATRKPAAIRRKSTSQIKNPPAGYSSSGGSERYSIRVGLLDLQPPCAGRHTRSACTGTTDSRSLLSVTTHIRNLNASPTSVNRCFTPTYSRNARRIGAGRGPTLTPARGERPGGYGLECLLRLLPVARTN